MSYQLTLSGPSPRTQVLLLHAPYPGSLKFEGIPSGLLAAVAPFAHRLAERGGLESMGLLDPGTPSEDYRNELRDHLSLSALRVLCISTSTAAIEETAWAVSLARALQGQGLFVVVGGPHEDDCKEKVAHRIAGVDLSIGGECEFVLDLVLRQFLARDQTPEAFLMALPELLQLAQLSGGRVTLASPWWGRGVRALSLAPLRADDLREPIWSTKRPKFSVFNTEETLPLMLSRGCPYGRCTFCSEPNREGVLVRNDFGWLKNLAEARPGASLYFQDSIMPGGSAVESKLLPLLRDLGRPWGCQVYLPMLSKQLLLKFAAHGCRYVYTGLESGSYEIRAEAGKTRLDDAGVLERLSWTRDLGVAVGISLMFGALSLAGERLETVDSVDSTVRLARCIVNAGVKVAGFYPNVMTVLPGTRLARGLAASGLDLDFYRMPMSPVLAGFEDGAVGYNFTTIPGFDTSAVGRTATRIVEAGVEVRALGVKVW